MNIVKRIMLTAAVIVLVSGCAIFQAEDYEDWVKDARVRAEHGEIKWSDYYQGCFSRLADLPNDRASKVAELEYYNAMIGAALDYESGRIKQSEFEEKRRVAQIAKAKNIEEGRSHPRKAGGSIDIQTTY